MAVELGSWVLLSLNEGEKIVVVEVKEGSKARLTKSRQLDSLILVGLEYGSSFEATKDGKLRPWVPGTKILDCSIMERSNEPDVEQVLANMGDNRDVEQDNAATQGLSVKQIEEMQADADVSSREIIERIVESSASFKNKTAFAKEKYLNRKQKKHMMIVRLIRPTAASIAEAYFAKGPPRVMYMRPDSLAQMLSMANVTAGHTVLVQENCCGVLAGVLTERLGGHGTVVNAYTEQQPPANPALRCFNFTPEVAAANVMVPLYLLPTVMDLPLLSEEEGKEQQRLQRESAEKEKEEKKAVGKDAMDVDGREETEEKKEKENAEEAGEGEGEPLRIKWPHTIGKRMPPLRMLSTARVALDDGADSLLIATKHCPEDVLRLCFPYLAVGGQLVIFHAQLQPLVDCYEVLNKSEQVVAMTMQETWTRKYQVLPMRTHPAMRMHGASGFVLCATKADPNPTPVDLLPAQA
eukprot:CAMPEP_0114621780 /NCGR_PEP_ID=MMETSP0168-20121206/9402_1 /TAXON_ID=95228 ORGANISM="Vannella sp., Strain DIVA3 517/6/12" /NCGR_SAMPLE_ID=MMETSP0168 /ASSEMBLY_ACC=CAM_ASM_000044 /LENGTH=465 /DNA_ID=CAMNT_0001832983 /DNA_START=72 /DNA_END=1466 /DNA_ORIENTATION=-